MSHVRNVLEIDMPDLGDLPLPEPRATRSQPHPVDMHELADRMLRSLHARTRSAERLRATRTPISRTDSSRFIRQLLADLQLRYVPGPTSSQFMDPYSPGVYLSVPLTLQELVQYYYDVSVQHSAEQAMAAVPGSDLPEEEDEEWGDDGGVVFEEEEDEPVGDCNEYRVPTYSSDGHVTACVWIRYVMRGEKSDGTGPFHHYDRQYGPIRMDRETYEQLLASDNGGREERVSIVEGMIDFEKIDGSSGQYNYDAGVVNAIYHAQVPEHNTGEPVYPDWTYRGSGSSIHHSLGYGDSMTRLSYAETVMVDHPFLTYSKLDLLQDDECDPCDLALEKRRIRDPYLRQNYVHNTCWMSHIIELVNTNTKRLQLTYDKLWTIMGRPGCFDPVEAQSGLSVEDMIPVFDHFDREVYVHDADRTIIYQRSRPPKGEGAKYVDVHPYVWRFMVTEHHVYLLPGQNNVNMQSVFGWRKGYFPYGDAYESMYQSDEVTHPYYRVSPLLSSRDFQAPMDVEKDTVVVRLILQHAETGEPVEQKEEDDDDCAELMEILFHQRFEKTQARKVVVLVNGCLIQNVILPMLRDFHYKPRVCFNGHRVTRVSICSLHDRGYIVFKPVSRDLMNQDIRLWVPYVTAQHVFYKQILDYASTFNVATMNVLRKHVRGGLFAWTSLDHRSSCERQDIHIHSVDVNRLYPACLLGKELPVVTCFDHFVPINSLGEYYDSVGENDLVLASFYGTSTLYSDRSTSVCIRKNLDRFLARDFVHLFESSAVDSIPKSSFSDGQTFVVPLAVLHTHMMPSTMASNMQSVWEDESLPRSLRKLVLNINIGKMGVGINERPRETMCFTTRVEAEQYQSKYESDCALHPVAEDLFICQRESESTLRLQGGYLLHLWVLDNARWRMQQAYDQLREKGVDVLYCCCDELYFPSEQLELVQTLLPPMGMDGESFEAFGTFKIGHKDQPISEMKTRRFAVGEMTPYLEPGYSIDEDVHGYDSFVREVAPEPSEYDIQNLERYSRLLIKASVPGAGKSHSVLSKFAKNAVVVCPTNALCVEFEKKYPGVVAMTLHKFLRISAGANDKQTFNFLDKRGGNNQDVFSQLVHETTTMYDTQPALQALDNVFGSASRNPESGKVLLLDEIYMYSLDLLVRLHFRLLSSQATAIYATGDINQLPPVDEKYEWMRHQRISAINQLFPYQMSLTKCKRMTLEEDNRSMEHICKDFLGAESLRDVKLLIRMSFRDMSREEAIRCLSKENDDYIAVCYYNRTCSDLATSVLTDKATPGVRLVNRKRLAVGSRVMQVNYEYEVLEVGPRYVKLKGLFSEDGQADIYEKVTKQHVRNHMHWVKTRTCHSLQGSSVSGKLLLFDLSSPHMTREFLYVALTRARDLSEVYIVPDRKKGVY